MTAESTDPSAGAALRVPDEDTIADLFDDLFVVQRLLSGRLTRKERRAAAKEAMAALGVRLQAEFGEPEVPPFVALDLVTPEGLYHQGGHVAFELASLGLRPTRERAESAVERARIYAATLIEVAAGWYLLRPAREPVPGARRPGRPRKTA